MLQWSKFSPNASASHSLEKKFGYWVRKFVNTQTFHFPVLHASACQHLINSFKHQQNVNRETFSSMQLALSVWNNI